MTYLVTLGSGYTVRGRFGDEIHDTETVDQAYCCDRSCAIRYLDHLGVPTEVATDHPLGHGAGDYIDLRDSDTRGDSLVVSWGEYPCADSPSHEYCPACGSLTIHGSEDGNEYEGRSCDDYGSECSWPTYVKPEIVRSW